MISPDNPQGLPVFDPFNSDSLEKLAFSAEEYLPDEVDTPLANSSSGESLALIEETPVSDLLLVKEGEKIDLGRLVGGDVASATHARRDPKQSDLLTGENPKEDTLTGSTTRDLNQEKRQTRAANSTLKIEETFNSGYYSIDSSGLLKIDYLADGGGWTNGQLAIVSLEGLDPELLNNNADLNKELARRALTNSDLGHIVISDAEEGALFNKGLGEFNHNKGEYLGEKTFSMNPGDKFTFMFVPNGHVQEVFNNPNIRGSKKPLYSLTTENSDDEFRSEQIVDVTGKGQILAFNDIRVKADDNTGRDYNDLIFSISGATGETATIDGAIDPQKDWRELDNGKEFLELVEGLKNDTEAPQISVELTNDTGEDNTDKITADPSITGTVTDDVKIASLKVGFEENSTEEYADITDLIDTDGSFDLDEDKLAEIWGEKLSDREYALNFIAEDIAKNQTRAEITFTLDTVPEFPLEFDSGVFTVDEEGEVKINYLADGGGWKDGQLAIVSLEGLDQENLHSYADFNQELARRALTNSELGYVVISDAEEGALFNKGLGEFNHNKGEYLGEKTFLMNPGDKFTFMFVPNGKLEEVFNNPNIRGSKSPLYSLTTENPEDEFSSEQLISLTGKKRVLIFEDIKVRDEENAGYDYNDLIFSVRGATGEVGIIDEAIDQEKDWRELDSGKEFLELVEEEVIKDSKFPEISAELANDTGLDNTDKITSDPTIIGTVVDENEIESLAVGFDENNLDFELKNNLDEGGNFELTRELLEEIKGEKLEDGTHTIYLKAADNFENSSEIKEFSLTLNTGVELTFELDSEFDSPPKGDGVTEFEIVSFSGKTEPNLTVTLEETGEIVTADDEGNFEFVEVVLELGENTFNATVEDAAGNRESVEIKIARDEMILIENDDFLVAKIKTVEIPEISSQLKINIADIAFDTTDEEGINDAFELALVDGDGNSLVHTIGSKRDSFFNFTEGETATLAAGVDFDGSTVTVNLSQVTPGIEATLLGRLVNNDEDTGTTVRIKEINIESASDSTPPTSTSELPEVPTTTEIDFDRLSDVSGMVEVEYWKTSFNEETELLYVDLTTESSLVYPLRGSLLVAVNLDDPNVRVIDADGTTSEGLPYYDLTDGESQTLAFYNPQGVQFDYDLVFLGQLNSAPEFVSDADVEAIVGKSYIYEALAVDSDGDELTYSLLGGPVGMTVDAETGEIVWEPTAESAGSHGVRVQATDEFGAVVRQSYVLSVVEGRFNRSPVWNSMPVVDASVNGDYVYEAVALDADGDRLSYSLVFGPEGMEVDGESGVVSWLPSGELVGLQDAILSVSDGNGGEALQEFGILVRQEVGNRSPIIVSEAPTEIDAVELVYRYPVKAIDSDEDALVYSLERAPDSMAIDPNTGEIVWNPTAEELRSTPESGSEPMVFFGEDISDLGDSSRLPATPNADSARDTFLSKLVGVETEDFESFAHGDEPNTLTFGTDAATFSGNPHVREIPTATDGGIFPTSGDKSLYHVGSAGSFEIEFSHPQAAFGFYATDVGDVSAQLILKLHHESGETTEVNVPHQVPNKTGSALYFGAIDVENPFTKVTFTNTNSSLDAFGFDDMTIGRLEQVSIPPVDVTVKVSDNRGGVDTQSFQVEVKEPLGEIQGTIWNDVSGEGDFSESETGLSGVEVYLDRNENGELDPDEPTTLTDSQGEYRFSDLTAGKYVVREVLPEGLEYTFPDTTPLLGPNLLKNGSFEENADIFRDLALTGGLDREDIPGWNAYSLDGAIVVPAGSNAIPHWDVTQGEVDYTYDFYMEASDGEIAMDLVGSPYVGGLSQTFDTVPGQNYLVTFDLTANPNIPAGNGATTIVKATVEQSATFVVTSTGNRSDVGYERHSWEFTANSDSTTLEFLPEGVQFTARGPFIDNVSVSEVTPDVKQIVSLGAGQTVKEIDFGNSFSDPTAKNSPPTFTSTNTTDTATAGELWSYQATATDLDKDPLTYFLIAKPDGMTVNPETGVVVWKPTYEQINPTSVELSSFEIFREGEVPGIYDVVLGVKDDKDDIEIQHFQVRVVATDKPVIVSEDAIAPAAVGKPYEYRFDAQNTDGATLTYRLDTPLEGMSLDETTGVLTWTPTDSQLGEQLVTVAVIDAETGVETSRDFNFTVVATAANSPPTITSTPRQRVRIGDNYLYTIDATDPNNDPLTYTLEIAPEGMSVSEDGRIFWQPTSADAGINTVSIVVSDGRGGEIRQEFAIAVTSTGSNRPPSISSTPQLAATVAQQYEYNLTGSDPDGDEFWWSLDTAPQGMSIDPEAGTIRWQPNVSQVGSHDVAVRLTDANGAFVGQAFSVSVRGVNVPPVITSTPLTEAVASKSYKYLVEALDVENDSLTFSLVNNPPSGMTVDPETGLIEWVPDEVGNYDVEVVVEDALGAVARQTYKIAVSESATNLPPTITSAPVSFATIGQNYQYDVTATDPDGDDVTYQLLETPDDSMTVDPETGLIEWVPTTEGVYTVAVGTVDTFGLGGAQRFTVDVAEAVAPIVASIPVSSVTAGEVYRYQVNATSVKGERISYSIESGPEGMSVDEFGRVVWMPDSSDLGSYEVAISISDPRGNSVLQSFELMVEADSSAPKVSLFASSQQVGLDETVNFVANAVDDVGVEEISLTVDGVPVAVDASGRASVVLSEVGDVSVVATAVDAAGNGGTATRFVEVLGISPDGEPPTAILDDSISESPITTLTDIMGSVSDDGDVDYVLEVAPVAGGEFVEIAQSSDAVTNGKLGSFDPSLLQNDSYVLRLTATDGGGNSSSDSVVVDVAGELKLGNFRLSFTDLSIPLSGIPISVTRTYDSLNASVRDDFGYGWRLEFRDTDLRTSVRQRTPEEELLGVQSPFSEGERVYVTLPGGERTGFTFKPRSSHLNGFLLQFGGSDALGALMYHPEFVADDGSDLTLRVKDASLVRRAGSSEYVENGSMVPYNPTDSRFGGVYELVTKSGVVYTIDAVSGDLLTVVDRNENKLTFSDGGIVSSTGVEVSFERDAAGRIVGVIDPEGNRIGYEYDGLGDLVGVTDREDNTTEFVYDLDDRPHYLEEIIDPLGRTGVKTEYDDKGRLTEILDINGEAIQLEYDPDQSKHTVKDVFGNPTTYIYDDRGNIVTEVDAEGGITQRTYDGNNNLKSETDPDGVVTKYTYDSNGNILTLEDGDGNITRMTYNQYGKVLSVVSPTGLSMSFKYDSRGNLIESTDTNGLKTLNFYDSNGKPIRQVAPDGQTTIWSYDSKGNPVSMTDSRGNEVKANYDNNGWMQSASMDFVIDGQTVTLSRSFTYDSEGRTLTSTTSQGNTQSQTYNALGKVASTTDILGNVTLYDYNDKGLLTQITLPDYTPNNPNDNPKIMRKYDGADRLVKETSPTGLVMEYVYDNLGRQIETILPDLTPDNPDDNPRTKIEYTKAGRVERQIDILGNSISLDYDNLGRLITETDILGNDTTYTYTIGGQIASITDPRNRTTSLVYDDKARLTQALFFDDTNFQVAYDELGRVASETNELGQTTRYEYDEFGRRDAVINALNERTEMEFDSRGNLLKLTDALGRVTRYSYDEYGRQTATVFANGDRVEMGYDKFNRQTTATDENGNVTKYSYDNFHRLSAMELANNARTSYSYDNLGQLVEISDALNRATSFEYDDFGRVVATVLPMGQRDLNVFDNFGLLSSYTDFNGDTINYSYDGFGRLQGKSFSNPEVPTVSYAFDPVTSQVVKVTDGRGDTVLEYDGRDRLSKLTNPDGKSIAYGYDVLDNMVSLTTEAGTTEYVYDALSRLDLVKDGSEVLADYGYDAVGNLVRTSRTDGTVEVRGYDLRDRLTDIETKNSVGVAMAGFSYTLDGAGNRTRVEEFDGRTVDYVYDAVNRLTQEKIGDRTVDYAYDLVGNRLSRNDSVEGLTAYSYDANDRLTEMLAGGVTTEFTYDDNGSMLSRSNGVEWVTYDWINDGENRLVGVNIDGPGGSSDIEYVYNAEGIRVAEVVDGVRTNYLVTPGMLSDVLLEYDADGTVTKDFVYGLGLVRSTEGGSDSFFHADGLGSVRLVTDTTGLVSDRFVYDAYGASLSGDVEGFGFAGERRDGETGLDYLRARYYDPELGRFISKDQFSGFFNDPMSMHDYQYAHANPVNYTDPTGYFTLKEVGTTISVAGILTSIGSSAAYVGFEYLTGDGITGDEALFMLDRWMAGFAHAVSGGLTTVIRGEDGQIHEVEHSFLWNMGVLAGTSVSFLVGFQTPAAMGGQVGATTWTANFLRVFDAVTDTYGAYEAVQGLTDGQWDYTDVFNLLTLVDFGITAFTGVKGSLATWRGKKGRTPNNTASDANRTLGEMGETKTGLEFQKPSACFVAGTEILTPDGEVAIEDIEVGDWVIADDPTTPGEIEKRQVLQTFVRETDVLVDLHVDGEMISTTEEHPFWVVDQGWVEAEDLRVGDLLITEDGVIIDVDGIGKREGDFEVYNFEVEDFHTYFVSDLEVLVHNACGDLNWSPKSKPTFGHTFERHGSGSKNTKKLRGRAATENQPQGQWTNNQEAADLLKSVSDDLSGPATITIPDGLGQVVMPDGSVIPTNRATVIPKPDGGYRTGYPVLSE